jgi:hypothetical protein
MSAQEDLPQLRSIRTPKHQGVSRAVCESYSEAAEVCLARHHVPPRTSIHLVCRDAESDGILTWSAPDETAKLSWRNRDDATRDGAYVVSLLAVEHVLGLVAISRADTRSGADYYLGRPEQDDLEEAVRLEISGVDAGGVPEVRRRLRDKEAQVARGNGSLPAYASVVGFRAATVLVSLVDGPQDE